MIPANNSENIKDDFFKREFSGYQISKFEAVHFHVVQEQRLWDSFTGQRISKAIVQTYNRAMFDLMVKNNGFVGMITHLLHDPRKKSDSDTVMQIPEGVKQVQVDNE